MTLIAFAKRYGKPKKNQTVKLCAVNRVYWFQKLAVNKALNPAMRSVPSGSMRWVLFTQRLIN